MSEVPLHGEPSLVAATVLTAFPAHLDCHVETGQSS